MEAGVSEPLARMPVRTRSESFYPGTEIPAGFLRSLSSRATRGRGEAKQASGDAGGRNQGRWETVVQERREEAVSGESNQSSRRHGGLPRYSPGEEL
mgnify:CR=1 FL=1